MNSSGSNGISKLIRGSQSKTRRREYGKWTGQEVEGKSAKEGQGDINRIHYIYV